MSNSNDNIDISGTSKIDEPTNSDNTNETATTSAFLFDTENTACIDVRASVSTSITIAVSEQSTSVVAADVARTVLTGRAVTVAGSKITSASKTENSSATGTGIAGVGVGVGATSTNTATAAAAARSSTTTSSFSRIFAKVFGRQPKPSVPNPTVSVITNNANESSDRMNDPTATAIVATKKNDNRLARQNQRVLPISKPSNSLDVTKKDGASEVTKKRRGKKAKQMEFLERLPKKRKTAQAEKRNLKTAAESNFTVSNNGSSNDSATMILDRDREKVDTAGFISTSGDRIEAVVTKQRKKNDRPLKKDTPRRMTENESQNHRQQIQNAVNVITHTLRNSTYPALFMNRGDGNNNHSDNDEINQNNLSFWPSPYRTLCGDAITRDRQQEQLQQEYQLQIPTNATTQHFTHMSSVCASIDKFAKDIITPAILGEISHTLIHQNKKTHDTPLRAFFGTLLLLRELLVQNIHAIFGPAVTITLANINEQNGNDTSARAGSNDTIPSLDLSISEVQEFEKQIFVTAIILTGLQSTSVSSMNARNHFPTADSLMDSFLHFMDHYDGGHPEFMDCLQVLPNQDPSNNNVTTGSSVEPSIRAIFPNLQHMNDKEHMAWTISCNYQRKIHPIYIQAINRMEQYRRKQRLYIYNTINNIHDGQDVSRNSAPATTAEITDIDDTTTPSQQLPPQQLRYNNPRMKVITPKATAVHISILKIQAKTR